MDCIILTTCANRYEAENIALYLLEEKYAACVNLVPQITSIYRWEGKIVKEEELLLLIKTKVHLFNMIKDTITNLNLYNVPEIIMLEIKHGNKEYLDWLSKETLDF